MMAEQPNSNYDKFNWWIKNNKITASFIIVGTVIIALSTFTDSAKNLLDLIVHEKRPDINGEWKAEVTYDWARATYTETFTFEGEGNEIRGTASFLKLKRAILEGSVSKDKIEFITKTNEISSWDVGNTRETTHRYYGKITNDKIQFTMQTEGGITPHTPIKFLAQKVSEIKK